MFDIHKMVSARSKELEEKSAKIPTVAGYICRFESSGRVANFNSIV